MIDYIPHIVTFILYIGVIYFACCNWFNIPKAHENQIVRLALRTYIAMTVYSSSLFMFNQGNWILQSHDDLVGDWASMLWLHGDHVVALTWLCGQGLLRVYLNFRSEEQHVCEHRRRKDDP